MIHWPGAVAHKFSTRIQPAVQNQLKPFMRPEEIPSAADCYDVADSADEDLRRRRAGQAGTNPVINPGARPLASQTGQETAPEPAMVAPAGSRSLLASPGTRALVSNVFRGAVNSAADAAREEAPRVAEDLGRDEYDKKRDQRRANRMAGNAERLYY